MASHTSGFFRFALAAAAVALITAAPAAAETDYTSPDGKVQLTMPDGWIADVIPTSDGSFLVAVGTAAQECRVMQRANPATTVASVGAIRRAYAQPFTADQWNQVIQGSSFTRGGALVSMSVDETGFFPRQLAQLTHEGRTVHAAVHGRPGFDLYTFCTSFDGPDTPDVYAAVIRSTRASDDAAQQAAFEAEQAARAAPPATPQPPAAQ